MLLSIMHFAPVAYLINLSGETRSGYLCAIAQIDKKVVEPLAEFLEGLKRLAF